MRVNAIAPGWFVTDINRDYLTGPGAGLTRDIPVGRFGRDGDLDGALLLLVSEAGGYMAGTTVVVDGGQMVALGGSAGRGELTLEPDDFRSIHRRAAGAVHLSHRERSAHEVRRVGVTSYRESLAPHPNPLPRKGVDARLRRAMGERERALPPAITSTQTHHALGPDPNSPCLPAHSIANFGFERT